MYDPHSAPDVLRTRNTTADLESVTIGLLILQMESAQPALDPMAASSTGPRPIFGGHGSGRADVRAPFAFWSFLVFAVGLAVSGVVHLLAAVAATSNLFVIRAAVRRDAVSRPGTGAAGGPPRPPTRSSTGTP